jgi:hypothetical protein
MRKHSPPALCAVLMVQVPQLRYTRSCDDVCVHACMQACMYVLSTYVGMCVCVCMYCRRIKQHVLRARVISEGGGGCRAGTPEGAGRAARVASPTGKCRWAWTPRAPGMIPRARIRSFGGAARRRPQNLSPPSPPPPPPTAVKNTPTNAQTSRPSTPAAAAAAARTEVRNLRAVSKAVCDIWRCAATSSSLVRPAATSAK